LQNFQVDLNTVKQLSSLVPAKRILISESGILTYQDLAEVVEQARISGFLIGEGLCNDRQNMAANFTEIFGPCPGSLSCKICGITSLADAQAVVKSGFSALGFIFYKKSPRYIPPQLARSVSLQLGINIKRVGVFVNERAAVVKEIARQAHLDYLQFHGDEDPAYLAEFDDFKIIKAVSGDYTAKQLAQYRVDYFLVDNITSQQRGGTGQTANWEFARELARDYPVILSGGLNGANVGTARQRVAPAALDFNSGVETKPGQKDVKKLRRLAQKLKEMDAL
jgi:phosphoribosylanthranilate isomerase